MLLAAATPQFDLLFDLTIVLAIAVPVVAGLKRLKVPSIAGFIVAGVLVGPGGLAIVDELAGVEVLAEVGVVLLLFGIGLELSLDRLKRLWRPILVGGALQVGITGAAASGVAWALGLGVGAAIAMGCLVAVSSTAIVLRALEARGELDAPHGRLTLGVLVFQDLCVVPMMLAIPLLAGAGDGTAGMGKAVFKAVAVLAVVMVASRVIVPRALEWIAATRERDLFVLSVFLVCIGTAWAVSTAGISLALGAFLAGLVVAGSEYRHQALTELIPLREVFASVFFVSVGMLVDPRFVAKVPWQVAGLAGAILLGKVLVVLLVGVLMKLPLRVSVLSGVALSQVGEFSFVLSRSAQASGLLDVDTGALVTAASIVTMVLTPVALALGPQLAAGMGSFPALTRLLDVKPTAESEVQLERLEDHVVIAGYGVAGQELARSLKTLGVPYVVVELNTDNCRLGTTRGDPVYFGDVTSPQVLEHLGLTNAREFVVAVNDVPATERAVRAARAIAPKLRIVARARYLPDARAILRAGADDVVTAEIETALELTRRVLSGRGFEAPALEEHLALLRDRGTTELAAHTVPPPK